MLLIWSSNSSGLLPFGLLALSFFLQSGWSPLTGNLLFGSPFGFSWGYDSRNGAWRRRVSEEEPEVSGVAQLVCIIVAVAVSFFVCRFLIQFRQQVRQAGFWATVQRLRRTNWREWATVWNAPHPQHQQQQAQRQEGRQPASRSHRERFAAVSKRVQQLPTQSFMSKEDLEALPLHDLKVRLREMGLQLRRGESLDRSEAIRLAILAMEKGGSSSLSCSVCCEDYASGDVLRRLPNCGHRFHLECIDRWLLTATDYSQRPASCPICNREL